MSSLFAGPPKPPKVQPVAPGNKQLDATVDQQATARGAAASVLTNQQQTGSGGSNKGSSIFGG